MTFYLTRKSEQNAAFLNGRVAGLAMGRKKSLAGGLHVSHELSTF